MFAKRAQHRLAVPLLPLALWLCLTAGCASLPDPPASPEGGGGAARDAPADAEAVFPTAPSLPGPDAPPLSGEGSAPDAAAREAARVEAEAAEAFAAAVRQETPEGYEAFLKRYPEDTRAGEVQQRLEALLYAAARSEGTLAACERYLQRFPQGPHAGELRDRRVALSSLQVMAPRTRVNIRAARTTQSAIRGQLRPGERVRAGLLRDGWYAVFALAEGEAIEARARGYVYAPLLSPAEAPPPGRGPPPAAEPAAVRSVTFQASARGLETVRIVFDRPYLPVLSCVEGKAPRILIEMRRVRPLPAAAAVQAGGRLVRWIHGRSDERAQSAVVVLEMDPERNYAVRPLYYERQNAYVLEIGETK